jgi:hypothetical protein
MKKIIGIGASVVLVIIVSLLVWSHSRRPSDSQIRQAVSGSWKASNPKSRFEMTITSDGGFAYGTSSNHDAIAGTWQLKDGVFIMTTTKSPRSNALAGGVVRCRVIRLDDHEFAFDMGGETVTLKR